MGRRSDHSESPVRNHRSSHRSPIRRDRSHSERSPVREKPSRRQKSPSTHSPLKEKPSSHTKSSKQTNSRSPSPRSKRLRRDRSNPKDDKPSDRGHGRTRSPESRSPSPRTRRLRRAQADKGSDRGNERNNHGSGSEKATRKERDLESERHDRRSGRESRDEDGNGSSKSRHGEARDEGNNSRGDHRNGNDDDSVAQMKAAEEALAIKEKQKPSFELSGKLAAETNRVKGVTLLYNEPPDARKPEIRWRLYVFKGGEALSEPLYVHRQTSYLFGRERRVADIPTDHPSCSKQHAVLQYRQVEVEQSDGMLAKKIRPYIMDLGSTNGTFINENRIEAERYYELKEKDTIKFGNSSREYVLLHENSAS